MNSQERLSSMSIASIYAFRMLGLFMIYPIFSVYAHHLPHSTPLLIGLALGIYGLTQACLQIPFGTLSDLVGRKTMISIGLVIFAIGSIIAASAHGLTGIIWGRAIQGAGAVGSSLAALVADSTKDENRLKAMSIVGMTIGLSFTVAIILGPIFNNWIGVPGIFALTACLAILGLLVLWFVVPNPKQVKRHPDSGFNKKTFGKVLKNAELLRLDAGIFLLHATLTATFIGVPLALQHTAGLSVGRQWMVYLPVMILSFVAMVPFIIIAEAKRKMKPVFCGAVLVLALSQGLLWPLHFSAFLVAVLLFFYFTAFILLEASLPSLVSKIAPLANKGSALGVYSTSQFLGIFFGGIVGGLVFHGFGADGTFVLSFILSAIWFFIAITMQKPRHLSTKIFHLSSSQAINPNDLKTIDGVVDSLIDHNEHTVYLKIDKQQFDENKLNELFNSKEQSHG